MKKIMLFVAIGLISSLSFAQKSEYNKNTKFTTNSSNLGVWFWNDKFEQISFNNSPVGYKKSYDQINEVLTFYSLDFNQPLKDKSVISSLVKELDDYETVSLTLRTEYSSINRYWFTKDRKFFIVWICTKDTNSVMIRNTENK